MTLTIGPLTNFGLLFPVMCFVFVFDQTLVGHLYRDEGLLVSCCGESFQVGRIKVKIEINPTPHRS